MEPSRSRTVVMATLLEKYLKRSVLVGLRGGLFVGSWVVLYIVVGVIADTVGWLNPPYPFLSLDSDPLLAVGGTVVGLFVVQSTGSLLLYHFLVGFEDGRSKVVVLLSYIGLGFGGGFLRITLPTTIGLALDVLQDLP